MSDVQQAKMSVDCAMELLVRDQAALGHDVLRRSLTPEQIAEVFSSLALAQTLLRKVESGERSP